MNEQESILLSNKKNSIIYGCCFPGRVSILSAPAGSPASTVAAAATPPLVRAPTPGSSTSLATSTIAVPATNAQSTTATTSVACPACHVTATRGTVCIAALSAASIVATELTAAAYSVAPLYVLMPYTTAAANSVAFGTGSAQTTVLVSVIVGFLPLCLSAAAPSLHRDHAVCQ